MKSSQLRMITALQILAVASFAWFLFTWKAPWNLQRSIGTLFIVVGIGGIAMARYQLGKSFSVRAEAHELVTTGVYAKIRNPIYVFGTVMLVGAALLFRKPELWLFVVMVIIIQVIRARREAQVLEAAFGDAYREYRRTTWF